MIHNLLLCYVMKNFNRRDSHGHHGSKRRELAQHAHSRGSHTFTHALTSTQPYNHLARSASSAISFHCNWSSSMHDTNIRPTVPSLAVPVSGDFQFSMKHPRTQTELTNWDDFQAYLSRTVCTYHRHSVAAVVELQQQWQSLLQFG